MKIVHGKVDPGAEKVALSIPSSSHWLLLCILLVEWITIMEQRKQTKAIIFLIRL